jgi:hypothetical protein
MFSYFAAVHAPRRQRSTTFHSFEAMLTMTILATICGVQNWVEIEPWSQAHNTLVRVFALLESTKVQQAFMARMSTLAKLAEEGIAREC